MDINKYEFPNFFVRKKYKNGPGTFNYSGYVYYADKLDDVNIKVLWNAGINFPGGKATINQPRGLFGEQQFSEMFKSINRLEKWKQSYIIEAIFNSKYEEIIHEV